MTQEFDKRQKLWKRVLSSPDNLTGPLSLESVWDIRDAAVDLLDWLCDPNVDFDNKASEVDQTTNKVLDVSGAIVFLGVIRDHCDNDIDAFSN